MKEVNEDELQFVARHYEEEALDTERVWRTLRQRTGHVTSHLGSAARRGLSFRRVAAAVGVLLVVGASIACGFWYSRQQKPVDTMPAATSTPIVDTPYRYLQTKDESIVLKYDNAPIADVLGELSTYYGRELVLKGAPAGTPSETSDGEGSGGGRRITGEIEATSLTEVVEILEATLDVEIEIQNK